MPSRVSPILNPSWNRNRSDIYLHSHRWIAARRNRKDGWYECENKVLWMKLYQRMLQTHHAHDRKLKGSAFTNIWECRHVPGILKWRHTFLLPHHKSDMKYTRLIAGLNAARQTPNVTLEESKRPLFLVLFAALDVTVRKSSSKAQGLSRLFMKNLTDISVIHVTILFRWNPSWRLLLWILPFYLWNVCYLVCFFCLFFISVSIWHASYWCNPRYNMT